LWGTSTEEKEVGCARFDRAKFRGKVGLAAWVLTAGFENKKPRGQRGIGLKSGRERRSIYRSEREGSKEE